MTKTLRNIVRLVKATAASTLLGVLVMASFQWDTAMDLNIRVTPETPAVADADALVLKHECWRGEAPKGVTFPGHVVIIKDGQARYAGHAAVVHALNQTFGDAAKTMEVVAFCR